MRFLTGLILFMSFASAQLPNPVTAGNRFNISGSVLDSVTAKTLPGAQVSLQPSDSNGRARATRADASGNFAFSNVATGIYTLSATSDGYAQGEASSQKVILVSGTQPDQFTVSLEPQASITGTVTSADSKAVADAQVFILRPEISDGRRRLATRTSAKTDKDGHYRVPGLGSGTCYVAVSAVAPSAQNAYPVTFSPNVIDANAAQPLMLRAGAEHQADVVMTPSPAFHIRGRMPRITDSTIISVMPPPDAIQPLLPAFVRTLDQKAGTFEFSGVLPGNYIVEAVTKDANNREIAAYRQVSIGAADLEGLSLTPPLRATLSGNITTDGDSPTGGAVSKIALATRLNAISTSPTGSRFAFDGALPPGSYRFRAALAPNWYVKSATQGGQDVVHGKVTVADDGGSLPLQITASPRGATIEGTVTWPDTGHRVPAHVTVLEPSNGEMLLVSDTKVAPPNEPAVVRPVLIGGLPPGQYVLYAWPDPVTVEYANPDALRVFDPLAQQLDIDEGQQVRVALKLALP